LVPPTWIMVGAQLASADAVCPLHSAGRRPHRASSASLAAGASTTVTLQFSAPTGGGISDTMSAINTDVAP